MESGVSSDMRSIRRADISMYLVHLTKGVGATPEERSGNASKSLQSILTPMADGVCYLVGSPEGLFTKAAQDNPKLESIITAVSLTETPLDYIENLVPSYSSYGLVFRKEFIRSKGGNPTFYLSTSHSDALRKAAMDLLHVEGYANRDLAKLLPFFSQFGKTAGGWTMDYHHEREWRVPGNIAFSHVDVFAGLVESEEAASSFSGQFPEVPFICHDWSVDRKMQYLRDWKSPSDRIVEVVHDYCPYGAAGSCPYFH